MPNLVDYAQFVLVRVTEDGRKLPVNTAGEAVSALDPANWMSYNQALNVSSSLSFDCKLGFALTEADPFFCLDIDHCLDESRTEWSPLAHELMSCFPGAKIEVSHSGHGLHIWGCCDDMPAHACKNTQLRIELYHKERYILLGDRTTGDENIDFSGVLPAVVSRWFSAAQQGGEANWTDGPCEEWNGPTDDSELIAKACASVNTAGAFGGAVTFKQLWEADVDALSKAYPDEQRAYDASSADAALAQRLAFWTGKDCERMQSLMRSSALYRDKYERADYLPRTIIGACSRQQAVYNRTPAGKQASADGAALQGGWVQQAEMGDHFENCVYIEDRERIMTPDSTLLKRSQFDIRYGGHAYALDERKTTRSAWEGFTQCMYWRPPMAHTSCFRPNLPFGELVREEGLISCNTYAPPEVRRIEGDATPFIKLVETLLPNANDREILMSYLAACVQHVGEKLTWCPILQGMEGNGKTLIGEIVSYAVGKRYSFILDPDKLKNAAASRFNGWVDRRVFVCIEEILVNGNMDMVERLKPLITNNRISIEDKGVSQVMGENRCNFLILTNYVDAMPITATSRRYAPLLTAQQNKGDLERDGLTEAYFVELVKWLNMHDGYAICAEYLNTYPIAERYNPAGACRRAPDTSGRGVVIEATRGELQEYVLEAAESGVAGFADGWLSVTMLMRRIEQMRFPKLSSTKRAALLTQLGYVPHPALPKGRTPRAVSPDGVRSTLYVKEGTLPLQVADPQQVCSLYEQAQSKTAVEAASFASTAS